MADEDGNFAFAHSIMMPRPSKRSDWKFYDDVRSCASSRLSLPISRMVRLCFESSPFEGLPRWARAERLALELVSATQFDNGARARGYVPVKAGLWSC